MKLWLIGAAVTLAFVKIHLVAENGVRSTSVVLQQPLSMPIDSVNSYCLRRLSANVFGCASGFNGQRASSLEILSVPVCEACYDLAMSISEIGRDEGAVLARRRNLQEIANMK